jgi:hypothetical protein
MHIGTNRRCPTCLPVRGPHGQAQVRRWQAASSCRTCGGSCGGERRAKPRYAAHPTLPSFSGSLAESADLEIRDAEHYVARLRLCIPRTLPERDGPSWKLFDCPFLQLWGFQARSGAGHESFRNFHIPVRVVVEGVFDIVIGVCVANCKLGINGQSLARPGCCCR